MKRISRTPIVHAHPEDYYFPKLVRSGGGAGSHIAAEVTAYYEHRYAMGHAPLEGEIKKGRGKTAGRTAGKKTADSGSWGTVGPVDSGASIGVSVPQPYVPEFASPDRLFYPSDPRQAMKYWRYFYALDPLCGNVMDMYSEMLTSGASLSGDGIDSHEIRDACEDALVATKALSQMRWMALGFLVDGEVVPHLIWSDEKGHWDYLGFQDPLHLIVTDIPFANQEPLLELDVPKNVKSILTNPDPKYQKLRDSVPDEFIEMLNRNESIVLNTEEGVSFLPRRATAYDTRGLSMFSRLWRTLILEDAIMNATMQTARRAAFPVKVVKMGNPATGWIPGPEHEERLRKLLVIAETDPQAWLIYHYGVSFDAWGTNERGMTISKEWDVIERLKMIALGVSKAFIHGEVSYSSAEKGLQVFLNRLQGLRTYFEDYWWYPKFFGVMAEKNGWTKTTEAELKHGVRVKRSKYELKRNKHYKIPTLVWDKSLNAQKKDDMIRIYADIKQTLGQEVSGKEIFAVAGLDWEEQQIQVREEKKRIEELDKEYGMPSAPAQGEPGMGGGGAPMGGGGETPPTTEGEPEAGQELEFNEAPGAPGPDVVPEPEAQKS